MLDINFSVKVFSISTVFGAFCGHWQDRFARTDFTSSCEEINSKGAESDSHNAGEKRGYCCRTWVEYT